MSIMKSENIALIKKAKDFFRDEIANNHIKNTKVLNELKNFNINPFLVKYKANFLTGRVDARSIAQALVYPRVLGTSIDTTFGSKLQKFCSEVLEGFASTTTGIDIEFIDKIDGRKKYCQIKAGPNTINKDDITTIKNHFNAVRNLARTNNLQIGLNDLVVGVLYGNKSELNGHYRVVNDTYPVFTGREFWYRLTGEENFYNEIIEGIGEIANEFDGSEIIEKVIKDLSVEIAEQFNI